MNENCIRMVYKERDDPNAMMFNYHPLEYLLKTDHKKKVLSQIEITADFGYNEQNVNRAFAKVLTTLICPN